MPARHILVPGPLIRTTGGSIYDRRIVEGMRAQGHEISVHELPADFPFPCPESQDKLASCLRDIRTGSTVIIDGLISGCVPDILTVETKRLRLVPLVHHPLADETGLSDADAEKFRQSEAFALSTAAAAIVTSPFTQRRLDEFASVDPTTVFVVTPGTDPHPIAAGNDEEGLSLLCVASLTRRKGYPILLKALSALTDFPWQLVCVGSRALDPDHAHELDTLIDELGLTERVRVRSDLSPQSLGDCYNAADVFVFPSLYEGYGMVITEAVSRALPIVTTTGGALRETAPKGATIFADPGNVASFEEALRCVMRDPGLRSQLAEGAKEAREFLPTWDDAATLFASTLDQIEAIEGEYHG